jgi:hypothetical protein
MDDIGHANLGVKFLVDAHENRYRVARDDLLAIANTMDDLIEADGRVRANLLDGSTIAGSRDSVYYILLLSRYSPSLKAKLQQTMNRTRTFAYWGPWLKAAGR